MKTLLSTKTANLFKVSFLSLLIGSSFLISPQAAQAGWEGKTARQIVRIGLPLIRKIKLPSGGNNQPQIMQSRYRHPSGQIVTVCQAVYPNGRAGEPYYC